ncbi:MAG: dihydroorotase [Lysobacterales bacterium CG17_big_fil_post_rev_8_21_14_2_50_64_11]|nr:MAG: dihydroorotase [Xanthomonadales bacterium CG17_big_fil_post_rev_8_21_14_2_50_64_11]PIX59399.1 MAG: dihydroorotase [Xanthomonadales bacterium CG_4_10_14_3_um_filter_64_11]
MQAQSLILRQPDDWHTHLRDGEMLRAVVGHSARQFARAIVMPNLRPPITTIAAARSYRDRIQAAAGDHGFTPLMTAYLSDDIDADEIARGFAQGVFTACKLYPANATTNAEHGVTAIASIHRVLERMQTIGMPLLIHGEVTEPDVDIFDREAVFIERVLTPLLRDFPALKVVLEHITSDDAVQFVSAATANVAATITPHHLALSRNALFAGGLRPHLYCLPVLKRERHRLSLRRAATSGNPKFFLGTDSAPHARGDKESACGCAGIFNAPMALESYASVFEQESALAKLEGFASEFGPRFYGLPLNTRQVRLRRAAQTVPDQIIDGTIELVPFHAGETLGWRFEGLVDA